MLSAVVAMNGNLSVFRALSELREPGYLEQAPDARTPSLVSGAWLDRRTDGWIAGAAARLWSGLAGL